MSWEQRECAQEEEREDEEREQVVTICVIGGGMGSGAYKENIPWRSIQAACAAYWEEACDYRGWAQHFEDHILCVDI
jgi:hypothetical protein